jgi:hypothetical protein
VKISFIKTEYLLLTELNEFQGKLKELSKINYNKLRKSILDNGFSEPFVVWECAKEKKIYVLGGNQRLKVLTEMKNAREDIPEKYPCNFIECESKWAAKKLLLALASQYGHVTEDGLYEFSIENEFNGDFLKENFEFPGLDLELFNQGYFTDFIKKESKMHKCFNDDFKDAINNKNIENDISNINDEDFSQASKQERYPVTFILEYPDYKKWDSIKNNLGIKTDKAAFLTIINKKGLNLC